MTIVNVLIASLLLALCATHAIAAEASDKPWFVGVGDKPKGPLSAAAVEKMIEKGEVDGATLAWQDGMADWQPLSQIARFRSLVVKPPPLPKALTPPPLPSSASSTSTPTRTSAASSKAKPPPMPSTPPIVMTPPPLPSTPPAVRRVIGASNGAIAPPTLPPAAAAAQNAPTKGARVKLVVAAPDDVRVSAEERLRECNLSADAVGVVRVLRGVVTVSTTPANACVSRVLQAALANAGVAHEEPFEILVRQ